MRKSIIMVALMPGVLAPVFAESELAFTNNYLTASSRLRRRAFFVTLLP